MTHGSSHLSTDRTDVIDLRERTGDRPRGATLTAARPLVAVPADAPDTLSVQRDEPEPVDRRRGWLAGVTTTPVALLLADVAAWVLVALVLPSGVLPASMLLIGLLVAAVARHGYRARLTLSALDQVPVAIAAAAAAGLAHTVAVLVTSPGAALGAPLQRATLLGLAVLAMRTVAVEVIKAMRRRGLVVHRTLVIGAGEVGRDLVARFQEHPDLGLDPVGVLDTDAPADPGALGVPWLGDVDRLARTVLDNDVDVVVVAFSRQRESELVEVLRTCDRLDVEFFFVPRLFEVQSVHADMDEAWGLPLLRVNRAAFRTPSWRIKRVLDIAIASIALLVISPVLAAVAAAVRWEGGPGVLFHQKRVGLDGRSFTMMKFRSLRPADESESATLWNVSNDDRMGPVGRIIRATSLDELPQLVNVVRGDMSLVGPRPERPHFVDEFSSTIPRYTGRHRVPAGLTGLAAVYGLRGDTSIHDRARIDNYYIENWSLWLDAKIVLRTVAAVFRRTGS